MSADVSLFFYGLRFEVAESDIELLIQRKHPWIVKARASGLHFYWDNFGGQTPLYYFFIGRKIAIMGVENNVEKVMCDADLAAIVEDTKIKLKSAGIYEEPKFYIQYVQN